MSRRDPGPGQADIFGGVTGPDLLPDPKVLVPPDAADTTREARDPSSRKHSRVWRAILTHLTVVAEDYPERTLQAMRDGPNAELARTINSVAPGYTELKAAGYTEWTGNYGTTVSGKRSHMHRITDAGHAWLAQANLAE